MSADQELAANFANQHELTQEKEREADLRAERSTTGAGNSIGLSYYWSGLEQSDRIKDLQRLGQLP
jgi:hypothetical protein